MFTSRVAGFRCHSQKSVIFINPSIVRDRVRILSSLEKYSLFFAELFMTKSKHVNLLSLQRRGLR